MLHGKCACRFADFRKISGILCAFRKNNRIFEKQKKRFRKILQIFAKSAFVRENLNFFEKRGQFSEQSENFRKSSIFAKIVDLYKLNYTQVIERVSCRATR